MAGSLSEREVALIKAMLATKRFPKDQIQAYFTRPDRVLNFGRLTDIERGRRGAKVEPATEKELNRFLETWNPGAGELPPNELSPFSESSLAALLQIDERRLRVKASESHRVEFKLSWNAGSADDYARSMAAFANNKGGYLVFGVQDGSGDVVGLTSEKFVQYDPAKLSARIHDLVQPDLNWDKAVIEIGGRSIGLIHVPESHLKPVVGIKDVGAINDGAVYFRYPGETRRIRHVDLINLIVEREKRLSATISDQVARIVDIGPYDVGILDTGTGHMDLSGRSLHLTPPLRHQIVQLARGDAQSDSGAFELAGNVGLSHDITRPLIVKGSISDYDVLRDFIDQANVANPFDYIRHFLGTQTLWLPLFRFVVLYAKPIPELIVELERLPKLKPQSWVKLRSRLEGTLGRKSTHTIPTEEMLMELDMGRSLNPTNEEEAIQAVRTLSSEDIQPLAETEGPAFETLKNALAIFDAQPTNRLFTELRYAASFVDQALFRQRARDL